MNSNLNPNPNPNPKPNSNLDFNQKATILKIWHCRKIEDSSWLVADYRLRCSGPDGTDSAWFMNALIAAAAFVLYPLGVPLFYTYKLYKNQDALYDAEHPKHEVVSAKFGFLYAAYEEQAWYWEVVMLMQKLLLTGSRANT